jgi:Ca2+/Na+ antiporter
MACANAVGSNVFNIFLGIGLPMIGNEIVWGTPFIVADGMAVLVSTCMLIVITILMVRAGSATSEQRLFASLRRF